MTDAFCRYLNCYECHVLVPFFIHKLGVFKIGIIISSSKISWAALLSTWTKIFMKLLQSLNELNECHIRHVTYVTVEMEKIQNDFNCLFFQSGKKSNGKAFISIKMLLFLKTIMASCANIPATRVSSSLWQWRLSGLSVFTLKTLRHHANLQI